MSLLIFTQNVVKSNIVALWLLLNLLTRAGLLWNGHRVELLLLLATNSAGGGLFPMVILLILATGWNLALVTKRLLGRALLIENS